MRLPEIRTILYCTQLGPNAAYVFRYAYLLAARLDARIVVLHVREMPGRRQRQLVEGYAGEGALERFVAEDEKAALRRIEARIRAFCEAIGGGPECLARVDHIVVAEGDAPEQILAHVGSEDADLVVMGAHADEPLVAALLGQTAERVIRRCPVPVLTVQVPEGRQEIGVEA